MSPKKARRRIKDVVKPRFTPVRLDPLTQLAGAMSLVLPRGPPCSPIRLEQPGELVARALLPAPSINTQYRSLGNAIRSGLSA